MYKQKLSGSLLCYQSLCKFVSLFKPWIIVPFQNSALSDLLHYPGLKANYLSNKNLGQRLVINSETGVSEKQTPLLCCFANQLLSKAMSSHLHLIRLNCSHRLNYIHELRARMLLDSRYNKYIYIFTANLARQDEKTVRCHARKQGSAEYDYYSNFVLPKVFGVLSYSETVELTQEVFCSELSLFTTHFDCSNLVTA